MLGLIIILRVAEGLTEAAAVHCLRHGHGGRMGIWGLQDSTKPIWVSLSQGHMELYREVRELHCGHSQSLEQLLRCPGPFWGRQYYFYSQVGSKALRDVCAHACMRAHAHASCARTWCMLRFLPTAQPSCPALGMLRSAMTYTGWHGQGQRCACDVACDLCNLRRTMVADPQRPQHPVIPCVPACPPAPPARLQDKPLTLIYEVFAGQHLQAFLGPQAAPHQPN